MNCLALAPFPKREMKLINKLMRSIWCSMMLDLISFQFKMYVLVLKRILVIIKKLEDKSLDKSEIDRKMIIKKEIDKLD